MATSRVARFTYHFLRAVGRRCCLLSANDARRLDERLRAFADIGECIRRPEQFAAEPEAVRTRREPCGEVLGADTADGMYTHVSWQHRLQSLEVARSIG